MQFKYGGSRNLLDCEGEHSWKQFPNNPTWQTCNPIPSIQQTINLKINLCTNIWARFFF